MTKPDSLQGSLDLLVLKILSRRPGLHGYALMTAIQETSREVLRVMPATEPMHIAVLVDTSQAMEEHMLDVRTALRAFFKQMGGKHEIALIGLGERPTVLSDYTRDAGRLEKAEQRLDLRLALCRAHGR